jgi:NAD(P)H-dependent FMN reductase
LSAEEIKNDIEDLRKIMDSPKIRIMAISGSLRLASSNSAFLRAASRLAPSDVEITIYDGLGDLPHFNPDIEDSRIKSVEDFQVKLQEADGVLISCPEYAHGVPGVLKNALDWVVGSGELVNKPVALFNPSPRSTYAQASLIETLTVMSARVVSEAAVTVALPNRNMDEAAILAHPEISRALSAGIDAFIRTIEQSRVEAGEAGGAGGAGGE